MRYLIGVLVFIFLLIIVIIKLLSGGGKQAQVTPPNLVNYAGTDTSVRYIIDNPVQADDTHRDIIVTVSQDQATLTITKGYQGEVVSSKSFASNSSAYAAFLSALDKSADFTKGDSTKSLQDERGYCGTGERYSYDIIDGSDKRIQHYWSTSCKDKTYGGDPDITRQLFEAQIPDFEALTTDVDY